MAEPTASPALFHPTRLDPRAWARAMEDAGMTFGVLTAKHHDGSGLWDSKQSAHDIASSPYRDGKGDVVREYVDAMHEAGLKVGFWDRSTTCGSTAGGGASRTRGFRTSRCAT
ncbi:alpha-L-fucosidase [Streptomyces boninensis]|uniref:alpha-L-fucosidase n=1 Tax=Streptomyces boninensis TaxID=2039455 RepID=UPI003B21CE9E